MVYEIVWGNVIKRNLRQVLNYLRDNASEKVAKKYMADLEKSVNALTKYPEWGMLSQENPNVRSLLFRKRYRVFYSVVDNEIHLLALFDTRQDPAKRPY